MLPPPCCPISMLKLTTVRRWSLVDTVWHFARVLAYWLDVLTVGIAASHGLCHLTYLHLAYLHLAYPDLNTTVNIHNFSTYKLTENDNKLLTTEFSFALTPNNLLP